MPEPNRPRIVVFGATGRLGRLLVHRLGRQGRRVLSIGRNTKILAKLPAERLVLDLMQDNSGMKDIRRGDVVINAAHARFTSAIIELCPPGIEKLIVMGSTRYLTRIPDVKAGEVRAAALHLQSSSLPWVLLHPTMIYGAEGEANVQRMAALIKRFHIVPLPGGGRSMIQPIHVQDVVEAVMRVIARPGLRNAAIHLGGPEAIPYWKFLQEIAEAAGSWVKVVPLPLALLRMAARLTALVPGVPVIKDAEVLRLQEDKAVDISGMEETLKLSPRPLKEGLAATFSKQD